MPSAMLQYPGNYLSILQLSVPGIGALLLALVLGGREPVGRRLWFLLPLVAVYVATFGVTSLAEALMGGEKIVDGAMWLWLGLYAAVVLVPLAVAVRLNRASPTTVILLSLFVVTFALPGFFFFGFAMSCGVGC